MSNESHLIFSDESGYIGNSRFGAIGVVSGSKINAKTLNEKLKSILDKYSKIELKFAKVKGHSSTLNAVKSFVSLGLKFCMQKKIKIHVIIWDKQDQRHNVKNRDDIENMKRMYYHILKRTKSDWYGIDNWDFYPDEFSAIDWKNDVVKYIERTNLDKKYNTNQETLFGVIYKFRFPFIKEQCELDSSKYPILQLTDIFTGIVRLSYELGEKYFKWLSDEKGQNGLFAMPKQCQASKNEICKFGILKHFKDECSKYKLGVNFSQNNYFKTFNNKKGIVLWLYKPQGDYDKAPVK